MTMPLQENYRATSFVNVDIKILNKLSKSNQIIYEKGNRS